MKVVINVFILMFATTWLKAENGHQLWLRGRSTAPVKVVCSGNSATIDIAREELYHGWEGKPDAVVVLKIVNDHAIKGDGFKLSTDGVQANTDLGILYGVYTLLRDQQTGEPISDKVNNPSYERRILDHWDNLNGTIERGYAGRSIFWHGEDSLSVTEKDKIRWQEYARADASIGINGAVLNNVNASPLVLKPAYLKRVQAIANVLRPYGVRIYLSANFASPSLIGGLPTSDPLDPQVKKWWKAKVKEIYHMIPDFGGFLVKANSEGQPGPLTYRRTYADGANMIADALEPYGGIVMWRTFVYFNNGEDRAKQAYEAFKPLDGRFHDNVILQVKNGPIDFQPREPFSPLFGAMKKTSLMPEVEVTQEYLGQAIHLVFLSTMWEEFLKSDTYQAGVNSSVARCTDGSIYSQKPAWSAGRYTAIAGVSNIGLDTNWCGHPFAQANWYAFGRLAWNNRLTSVQIADEWIKLTFYRTPADQVGPPVFSFAWKDFFLKPVKRMMLESREAAVNYMTPLGLNDLFSAKGHYGPGPWWAPKGVRADWTPPYFHRADSEGIGFDRTTKGSDAVSQYHEPLSSEFNNLQTCPDKYLLWFHHVPWAYRMKNGRTLWANLCYHYQAGLDQVRNFQKVWDRVQPFVDSARFYKVQSKLRQQCVNAQLWKDACLLYFQQFSKMPIPYDIERPVHDLQTMIKNDETYPNWHFSHRPGQKFQKTKDKTSGR
jgi:alpha-glucuronidase